jgi:putative ABC transport system substrate-binding protein
VVVTEPVAQGFVASLARPGGNITGFSNLEPTVGSKWLELLREMAPGVTRVSVMFNPETNPFAVAYFRWVETAALRFAVDARLAAVHGPSEIEPAMTMLAHEAGGGLIVAPDTFTTANRKMIVDLAARYRLPAIYPNRAFADDGGLAAYGPDVPDEYRRAAGYVDRILNGEKPADLPVQQPTKFELVINLKTAKVLGDDRPRQGTCPRRRCNRVGRRKENCRGPRTVAPGPTAPSPAS